MQISRQFIVYLQLIFSKNSAKIASRVITIFGSYFPSRQNHLLLNDLKNSHWRSLSASTLCPLIKGRFAGSRLCLKVLKAYLLLRANLADFIGQLHPVRVREVSNQSQFLVADGQVQFCLEPRMLKPHVIA